MTDRFLDQVVSTAPDTCPECNAHWHATECPHTGDDKAANGWEDWCYCKACEQDWFYPLKLPAAAA